MLFWMAEENTKICCNKKGYWLSLKFSEKNSTIIKKSEEYNKMSFLISIVFCYFLWQIADIIEKWGRK